MVSCGGAPRPATTYAPAHGEREEEQKSEEPAEHGLHHTSLIKSGVRDGEWRYRLRVRTDGSQPSNRGSIPRTATIIHSVTRNLPLGYSLGRWPGLFCWRPCSCPRCCEGRFAGVRGSASPADLAFQSARRPARRRRGRRRGADHAGRRARRRGVADSPCRPRSFLQAEPHEGQPATELTEVRLAFDREALYIGVVCHSSDPASLIVNDIRKDFVRRRAGHLRGASSIRSPTGATGSSSSPMPWARSPTRRSPTKDATSTRAGTRCGRSRPGATPSGWSAELRIPFKTLRFESRRRPDLGRQFQPAGSAARTKSTTGRRCRASTTCIAPGSPAR